MTSVARRQDHDSGDYSDASHPEIEQENSVNDAGQQESDYESQGSESDRSDQDPENQETERRVDDDEDRSNPQYIPKRGTFYEHDDRTAASGEESSNTTSETVSEKKEGSETSAERRRAPRKSETINKWSHDKYNENEQMPKSRDELVMIYGYDIRNEDAPPHARRNRRYGRGPNKYTRTWEDEEAYRRQAAAPPVARKPPNPEDFPELDAAKNMKKRAPRPRSKSQPSSNESVENGSLRRNASIKAMKSKPSPRQNVANRNVVKNPVKRESREVQRETKDTKEREKMPALENLTITATVFNNSQGQPQRKVNAAVAQQRPVPTEQGKKRPPAQPQPPTAPKSPPQQQTAPQQQKPQQQNQQQQQQAEPRGSKRYSSLRQRPLDTYAPQQNQNQQQGQHRYNEYPPGGQPATQHQGSPAPHIHPQQLMQQMHRNAPVNQQHGPSPPHQALPQQQLPQQQLPQQQLPQQQLPQQQLPQQQLPPQQIPQQQLPQQQLPQQQLPKQQLPQQQLQQGLPQQQHNQQVRLGILDQQQLVSHPHLHNMPQPHTMVSGQLPPAQGYAPPAMMPAQYMQPQSGSGAVFGAAPIYAQPPAPYPHPQMFPHHNFVSINNATQAGGVTYYSCAEQETLPRTQRRPTAAIPIVRPAAPDRPANSSEKDNIDRIVENMFVRKPWPAAQGAESKDKLENRNSQEPPSKESSQPNSLTSSSISTDSKPSESREESQKEDKEEPKETQEPETQESIPADA